MKLMQRLKTRTRPAASHDQGQSKVTLRYTLVPSSSLCSRPPSGTSDMNKACTTIYRISSIKRCFLFSECPPVTISHLYIADHLLKLALVGSHSPNFILSVTRL